MNDNILNIFVENLNGKLPSMTNQEKEEYINYSNDIKNYEVIIFNCFQDKNDYLIKIIEKYIESLSAQNSLLNDLYYKDGIKIGVKLYHEINKK